MQCAAQMLIDKEKYKFVQSARKVVPCEIDVPWYFWRYDEPKEHRVATGFANIGGTLQNTFSVMRKTKVIELRGLSINFTMQSYRHAVINFFDKIKKSWVQIEIDAHPDTVTVTKKGKQTKDMLGVSYDIEIGGVIQSPVTVFGSQPVSEGPAFRWIPGLGQHSNGGPSIRKFSYGVTYTPYKATYKGRDLGGTTNAMLCGPWAILLDDDLSFDSLVLLKGAVPYELDIDQFIYTNNTYVIKVMTLWK